MQAMTIDEVSMILINTWIDSNNRQCIIKQKKLKIQDWVGVTIKENLVKSEEN